MQRSVKLAGGLLFTMCGLLEARPPIAIGPATSASVQCLEADVQALEWLAGLWESETDEIAAEEFWMAPQKGLILGIYREDEGASAGIYFHFARIECGEAGLVLVIAPDTGPPEAFQGTNVGERRVTFERREDGSRRAVTYSLEGDSLRVELTEQEGAGEAETHVLVYRRIPQVPVTGPEAVP